jgi:DNA-directed RNA polymerase specialized sigma24 family protein
MSTSENDRRSQLAGLSTSWTLLFRAQGQEATPQELMAARQELLDRYESVITRYLRGALRWEANHEEAVEECFQNLAVRFVGGKFQNVTPDRGRFRDYLKTCILNVVRDYQRKQRQNQGLPIEDVEPAGRSILGSAEEDAGVWREALLSRAMKSLAELERQTGKPLHSVLRLRRDHPRMPSHEMAEKLTAELARPVTAAWVRKKLEAARERFCRLLYEETAQSLESTDSNDVEQELADLGLLGYCRPFLDRKG